MSEWPVYGVQRWDISRLRPYVRNTRVHPPAQIAHLRTSLRQFGWTMPILARSDGIVIAGHARLAAAQAEGLTEVPVIVANGWSEAQCRAYTIADNKLMEGATWDQDALIAELLALINEDAKITIPGFDDAELMRLLHLDPLGDPEAVPEPPAIPVSQRGDVWLLGKHRLVCGDATNADDVALALAGVQPHLMVTDPPYGVDYDPDWRNQADRAKGKPCGDRAIGLVHNDDCADWREAWALFPGDVVYAWHPAGAKQVDHYAALVATGFEVRMQIIWAKQQFPIGRGNYHVQHEPCWYAIRKGKTAHWSGDRSQSTLWQIDKPVKSETGHSTQKPVECMRRPIENNSSPGQAVYDPFVGSGTTIIAAEMTARACHALEINPGYVDVAIERWQTFCRGTARLQGTGESFAQIKQARAVEVA